VFYLMSFDNLGLSDPLLRAVRSEGYQSPTPIQSQAVPHVLKGRDLMACAQTGTGKTAAYALPMLQRLAGTEKRPVTAPQRRHRCKIRALVLLPTRELAVQIGASVATYGKYIGLRHVVVYGGVPQGHQVRALQNGVDILVATPGRLLDLMQQGHIDLSSVQMLILDEGDQMLDMGFIEPLRRIVAKVPRSRQTLMFSATMPEEIRRLANEWLNEPIHIRIVPAATPAERIEQSVYFVEPRNKPRLLTGYLQSEPRTRTLVFARTKRGADKIVKHLLQTGIRADSIHGNKSQAARARALERFKSKHPPVLVATDIAARGLDIEGVSHVINYDLPEVPEIYVHRIGRTARAGTAGTAVSFCGTEERSRLRMIERLTRRSIAVEHSHPMDVAENHGTSHVNDGSPVELDGVSAEGKHPRPYLAKNGDEQRNFRKRSRSKWVPDVLAPMPAGPAPKRRKAGRKSRPRVLR
jgi:ATP-dependent RNA helicase RhlE